MFVRSNLVHIHQDFCNSDNSAAYVYRITDKLFDLRGSNDWHLHLVVADFFLIIGCFLILIKCRYLCNLKSLLE